MMPRRCGGMEGITDSVRAAAEELERIERERERLLADSRRVMRLSKAAIHAVHAGEASPRLGELEAAMGPLRPFLEGFAPPNVQDAAAEYAEARMLASVVTDGTVPSMSDLGIPAAPWVLGLADCVGELRRILTYALMDGDMALAKKTFGTMESIGRELMTLDVPDAVAPVRRKQDIVRGVLDRTRSDMTAAAIMGVGGR